MAEEVCSTTCSWEEVLKELCAKPKAVVAIVGPKAAGKSSFARELFKRKSASAANCCYIETDLGRPEFIFPGVISIHNSDLNCVGALYFGEDEPSARPQEYLEQIASICAFAAQREFAYQIINTHGWVAMGQGQDILEGILRNANVTDVVEIVTAEGSSSLVRPGSFVLHTLTPAITGRQRESKPERNNRFARAILQPDAEMYAVGLAQVRLVFPEHVIERHLPFEFALLALNTSVVGLFAGETERDPSKFLGIGLVSGMDLQSQCIFLYTSVQSEALATCRIMVMGTTNRLEMSHFPVKVSVPLTATSASEQDLGREQQPYVTLCKLVGFGSGAKRKSVVKRRRLE